MSRRPRRYILMRSRAGVDEVLKYLYLGKSVISIQRWQAGERNCYCVLMEEVESSVSSHLTTVAFLGSHLLRSSNFLMVRQNPRHKLGWTLVISKFSVIIR